MTDVPGDIQERTSGARRTDAIKPRSGGSQSRFNPLHPSMELPPEQLIRLLGLEAKSSRSNRDTARRARAEGGNAPLTADRTPLSGTDLPRMAVRAQDRAQRQQKRQPQTQPADRWRASPMLLAGAVVAGAIVVAYLLLGQQPVDLPGASLSQTTAAKVDPATVAGNRPAQTQPAPAQVTTTPQTTAAPTPATPPAGPLWDAAVRAQEKHLQDSAAQRFQQRLELGSGATAPSAVPQTEEVPPSPEDTATPAPEDTTAQGVEPLF